MTTATVTPPASTFEELEDAIRALDDREELEADGDARARLRRMRGRVERELADLLAA